MDAWGWQAFFPSAHPSRSDIGACGAGAPVREREPLALALA